MYFLDVYVLLRRLIEILPSLLLMF